MQRPGPLRDIPLDRINLADNAPHSLSFKLRPNKRPLSPNASDVYTPAKRQLVSLDAAGPLEKSSQTLLWSVKDDMSTPVRTQAVRRSLSVTPRKLDFGVAKSDDKSYGSPMKCTPPSPARPTSPSLAPDAMDVDDCFSPTHSSASELLEPAVLTSTDRNSIHYPGFDVHIDGDDTSVTSLPASVSRKLSLGSGSLKKTKEQDKENVLPLFKQSKAAKGGLLASAGIGASMKAAGVENRSLFASEDEFSYSPKPRPNPHQLADRGQTVPWLTPDRVLAGSASNSLLTRLLEVEAEELEWEIDM